MSQLFDELVQLMATLRAPGGCPWDRKQTHESLKPYLLEEAYEVLETIDQKDSEKLKEELGDLLLQVLFHTQIATETETFSLDQVIKRLSEKLIRRHPHVFRTDDTGSPALHADQVLSRWEEIKRAEREASGREESVLDGVPKTLPALLRAFQVQARTSRVGFDWPHTNQGLEQLVGKIEEEIGELRAEWAAKTATLESGEPHGLSPMIQQAISDEFGDVLFSLVNLARFLTVNPEDALRQATNRFADRFHHIESVAARMGRALNELSPIEMDALWEEAKRKHVNAALPVDEK